MCRFLNIGISYDSDIDLAREIIVSEALKHPLQVDPRTPAQKAEGAPEVPVRVTALADSAVNLRAWVWGKDQGESFVLYCDLLESIKKRFDREGIEIPYPHRTLVEKKA